MLGLELVHVASVCSEVVLEGRVFRERERVAVAVCVCKAGADMACCCCGSSRSCRRRGGFVHGHHLDTGENLVGGESRVCALDGGQEAVENRGGWCCCTVCYADMLLCCYPCFYSTCTSIVARRVCSASALQCGHPSTYILPPRVAQLCCCWVLFSPRL